jgi:hypothetical protein
VNRSEAPAVNLGCRELAKAAQRVSPQVGKLAELVAVPR